MNFLSLKLILIILFPFGVIFFSCTGVDEPVLSNKAFAKALSSHLVDVKSYEIPKGVFRGALWPEKTDKNFTIWVISGSKELYFSIPAPASFVPYKKEVTEDWEIKFESKSSNKKIYTATKKDNSKLVKLELPIKKREYSFSVLSNDSGEEILIFMDISENITDKGLFGYVLIKNKP